MYQLLLYEFGATAPSQSLPVTRASDVLDEVARLLADRRSCDRVEVRLQGERLFVVGRNSEAATV